MVFIMISVTPGSSQPCADNLLGHTTIKWSLTPEMTWQVPKGVSIKDQMVAIARGIHLLPFRTEKLSPFTPMVLPQGGRVGSCLSLQLSPVVQTAGLFLLPPLSIIHKKKPAA
jgi:hypothetical protein